MITAALKQDPRYLEQRVKEYKLDMEYFGAMLFRIYEVAPPIIMIYENGDFRQGLPDEWQKQIDNIIQQKNEYVKATYPEFKEQINTIS